MDILIWALPAACLLVIVMDALRYIRYRKMRDENRAVMGELERRRRQDALRNSLCHYVDDKGMNLVVHYDTCPSHPREDCTFGNLKFFKGAEIHGDEVVDDEWYDQLRTDFALSNHVVQAVWGARYHDYVLTLMEPDDTTGGKLLGYYVVSSEEVFNGWGKTADDPETREKVLKAMKGHLQEYEDYLNGSVYRYTLYDDHWSEVDQCAGFYGSDRLGDEYGLISMAENAGLDFNKLKKGGNNG